MPRTWQRGRNAEFLGRAAKFAQRRKWGALLHACRTALAKAGPAGPSPQNLQPEPKYTVSKGEAGKGYQVIGKSRRLVISVKRSHGHGMCLHFLSQRRQAHSCTLHAVRWPLCVGMATYLC